MASSPPSVFCSLISVRPPVTGSIRQAATQLWSVPDFSQLRSSTPRRGSTTSQAMSSMPRVSPANRQPTGRRVPLEMGDAAAVGGAVLRHRPRQLPQNMRRSARLAPLCDCPRRLFSAAFDHACSRWPEMIDRTRMVVLQKFGKGRKTSVNDAKNTVLVTGAAMGIGRSVAETLRGRGQEPRAARS